MGFDTWYAKHGKLVDCSENDAWVIWTAALSQPVAGVVESLALADKLYEAADALDAWLSTDDNFEGDVPDDVWVPLQKAMQDYEKSSRIAPAPAVEPCKNCYWKVTARNEEDLMALCHPCKYSAVHVDNFKEVKNGQKTR